MEKICYKFISTVAAMSFAATAYSAPQKVYGQETSIAIREMRASIDEMRHEMNNHESEIRTFEEKLSNQEVIIEALREQNVSMTKTNQELTKGNLANLEMKIGSLDTASKGLVSDLRQLKTHANDSSSTLSSFQQKIATIEKVLEIQTQNLENLQAAMRSLMTVLEVKNDIGTSDELKTKNYRVQAGDSLEKIAKANKTTIKAIKEFNDLNSDRIIVGQNIKIP
jgi:LysM repeat protein